MRTAASQQLVRHATVHKIDMVNTTGSLARPANSVSNHSIPCVVLRLLTQCGTVLQDADTCASVKAMAGAHVAHARNSATRHAYAPSVKMMADPAGHSYVLSRGLSGSMSFGRANAALCEPLMNFVPCILNHIQAMAHVSDSSYKNHSSISTPVGQNRCVRTPSLIPTALSSQTTRVSPECTRPFSM